MIHLADAIRIVSGDDYRLAVNTRNDVAMDAMYGRRTEAEADEVRAAFLKRWMGYEAELHRGGTWKDEPRHGCNWTGG